MASRYERISIAIGKGLLAICLFLLPTKRSDQAAVIIRIEHKSVQNQDFLIIVSF